MKIDFYWFNVDTPVGYSTGVALLSQELKGRGHEVRLCQVDERVALPWDPERLAAHSAAFTPDVIAVSFVSGHAEHARRLVATLDAALPEARVVVGGLHPTLAPEEVFGWPGVDALGRGECDGVLADFVDAWAAGESAPAVPNFWVRRPDGSVQRCPMGPLPALDGMAPFNEDLDVARLVRANRGLGSLGVTRGCPFRCSFCHNKGVVACYAEDLRLPPARIDFCRRRSVDDAVAEVLRLQRLARGEMKVISFDDDTLLADREWFLALARRIKDEVGLPYAMMGTVDRIDEEVAEILAETDCLLVKFGLESASPRLCREILKRALSLTRLDRAFALLRERGVSTRAYVMVGIPTETRDELLETFRVCGSLRTDSIRPAFLQPYPRTDIHAFCVAHDLLAPQPGPTSYFTGSPLRWPAAHALLLRRIMTVYPWLATAAHPDSADAASYRTLAEEALAMDEDTWRSPRTAALLRARELELDRRGRESGTPHYLAPFPDRPDTAFLIRPGRRPPLPNIDDAWPPDAPWRDEPLPPPPGL